MFVYSGAIFISSILMLKLISKAQKHSRINCCAHCTGHFICGRGAVVGKSNSKENHLYFPHLYDVMKDYFQIPGKVTTNQLVGCTMVDGVMHIYIKMQCSST